MDKEIAKAINTLSKKTNEIIKSLDTMFNKKCDENKEDIISAEQTLTDMDLQNIETEQIITDMDLRILELEAK